MMEFLDKLGESLTTAGRGVSQRAKEVSEIARLKLDIRSKEDYVRGQYALLGMDYYAKHKDDESSEEAEPFFLIKEALAEIERMEAEVLRLQGAAECPQCGTKVPVSASYCSNCGTKMPKEEKTAESAEAEAAETEEAAWAEGPAGTEEAAEPAAEESAETVGTEE